VLVDLGLMIALGLAVVFITRVIVRGIELYAASGAMTAKAKGQFLGYATSLPELVGTVGTAGNGLLSASLWNVASSNIINLTLFVMAASFYRRVPALFKRKFLDEIAFALVAFGVPLVLCQWDGLARSPLTAVALFGFFLAYLFIDHRPNPDPPPSMTAGRNRGDATIRVKGIALTVVGVLGIVLAGNYLGDQAEIVVRGFGVSEWAVGWILGFITSMPEMTAFFAVFASAREGDRPPTDDTDCQENLDSLAASNMSNLGFVFPIGIAVYLFFGRG
jgi:Ca2+/Na+ antiporter